MRFSKYCAFPVLCFSLLALAYSEFANANETQYQIEISKSANSLVVKKGERAIKKYRIASGKGGKGTKQKIGDNRTPIGVYSITQFKADSKFHYFMQLNYPNLIDAWYGYKNNIINAKEFKRIAYAIKEKQHPPQDTALGGYIGIHGLGDTTAERLKIHDSFNWTEGCIALTNEQVTSLREFVSIGTRVTIRE